MKQKTSPTAFPATAIVIPQVLGQAVAACRGTGPYRGLARAFLSVLLVLAFLLAGLAGCMHSNNEPRLIQAASNGVESSKDRFVVYIAHVNDTHAHLDPITRSFALDGHTVSMSVGGYPRLHTQVDGWRKTAGDEQAGFLFLHAGDTFQGSGYFMLFYGEPEAAMWNRIGLDAMVLGNHEFDSLRAMDIQRDAQGRILSVTPGEALPAGLNLAEFIRLAHFPVLAANMHVPDSSLLSNIPNLVPWVITEVEGRSVGIFGIVLADMPEIAYPGKELIFLPEADVAREMVSLFEAQGVDRIIMISHIGYEQDMEIARSVDGIDVIVGGHSHSVLGDFSPSGLESDGPYPTIIASPSGWPTVVVQAGAYASMAGLLRVVFNDQGEVVQADGANHFLILANQGDDREVDTKREQDLPQETVLGQGAVLSWGRENPQDREFIDQRYGRDVKEAYGPVIAMVAQPLDHERIPADPAGHGSILAPLTAEALAAGLALQGEGVDFALLNAGSVRASIPAGPFRENQTMLEIMIFGNRVAAFALTGAQTRAVLESVISSALANSQDDGRFPYPARLKYSYDAAQPEGGRLSDLTVWDQEMGWRSLEDDRTYRVASSYYIASGRDGYDLLKQYVDANASLQVFSALDNQMFVDYVRQTAAQNNGFLLPLDYAPVTLKNQVLQR
ncbi:MAG TPA: bifunctional metallophosphatase/5'-nucleotidase [Desulfonatronum sp.]|nr:bifunctional metallophosphatase/5'-nucleotidase [Desulfonatronum sp.]